MEQIDLGNISNSTKFDVLSKEELIEQNTLLQAELAHAIKEIYRLKNQHLTDDQLNLALAEHLGELQNTLYGASFERYKKPEDKKKKTEPPKPRVKKLSERYPNIPVREELVPFEEVPHCDACGKVLIDSGMTEESEQLTVIPKKYEIVRLIRPKFRCSCHACIKTAPLPPRIIEGSSYSDEMIIDVVASKYCDLIPIERYVKMAARGGLKDLPPQSLIELTHGFADFVKPCYQLIKNGVMVSRVVNADETPHKMLEGSSTKSWYLWGFSTPTLCFLEAHDTRSGDVASDMLLNSQCEVLVSDVFSGYGKAIKNANLEREKNKKLPIQNANCNGHARRYFFKPRLLYQETEFYLEHYHQIYRLNADAKDQPPKRVIELRLQMKSHFEEMKKMATTELPRYPNKNKYQKALNYFLENYNGLTRFLLDPEVPIDNDYISYCTSCRVMSLYWGRRRNISHLYNTFNLAS
ncbi:MAG: IS66 family transposase [Bdellovibrionales bacterium]|nr:IS66 family transposase [Bdellovibrionales bacterium]